MILPDAVGDLTSETLLNLFSVARQDVPAYVSRYIPVSHTSDSMVHIFKHLGLSL